MNRINQMEPWIGDEERHAVMEYLSSGGWLTEFRKTKEFEQMIAEYVGTKYASAVNNGTLSLIVALMALGIGNGDEVIVPDLTMIASANSIVIAGAKPVFVDISRSTLCLDYNLVQEAVNRKTKAIMLVTLNGRYPEMHEFTEFAKDNGLFLVEDAAQSLGSRCMGKHLGTFGDVGSFSFSTPKIVTTGQGGALVTDNQEIFRKISMVKDFGRPRSGVDYHEIIGLNCKFTDLQAVIGIEQMKKLDWRVKRKKEMYRLYIDLLKDVDELAFTETNVDDTAPWFVDIIVKNGKEIRDELALFLENKGIGTRPFYPAIHTQPPYHNVVGDFRNSEYVSERGLWLPSSSFLSNKDLERICADIRLFFRN